MSGLRVTITKMIWRVINNNDGNGSDTRLNSDREGEGECRTQCGGNSLGDTGLDDSNSSAPTLAVHDILALARAVSNKKELSVLNKNGQLQLNENELMFLLMGGTGLSTQDSMRLRMPQHEEAVAAVKMMCISDGRIIFRKGGVDDGQEELVVDELPPKEPPPEPPPAPNIPVEPPPYSEERQVVNRNRSKK